MHSMQKRLKRWASDLAAIDKRLEALNGVKEKVQHINSTEMKIAESMSTDAYKVYRKYMDMLGNAPGMASRAARVNAVMFAHMMERLAENTRRATGNQEYTAMDAANRIMLNLNGKMQNEQNAMSQVEQNAAEAMTDEAKEQQRQIDAKNELLESAPVVEIKDSPLVGKSKAELKEYFREMYQHTDPNEKYPLPTIAYTKYGEPVKITINGTFKEIMHHSADGNVVKLIPYLKEIIENSIFLYDKKPFANRIKKNSAATISYKQYGCKIMLDGQQAFVRSTVRIAADGTYYYDLNVDNYRIEKKDSSQFGRPDYKSGPPVKNPSKSAFIISDWLEKVNTMEADNKKDSDNFTQGENFNQVAWHGSPYDFDSFDLGAIGSGTGANMHGWGLYFAHDKSTATAYKKALGAAGIVYRVDIPDKKNMMPEYVSYKSMSPSIRKKIENAYNALDEAQKAAFTKKVLSIISLTRTKTKAEKQGVSVVNEYDSVIRAFDFFINGGKGLAVVKRSSLKNLQKAGYTDVQIEEISQNHEAAADEKAKYIQRKSADIEDVRKKNELAQKEKEAENERISSNVFAYLNSKETSGSIDGDAIYNAFSAAFGQDSKAASLALNASGIEGIEFNSDGGECYVVFSDKAISIIEKYNQDIKGQTAAVANGQYIVSLFEKADESTFMHEMAHVYLLELEKLAALDEQCRADMNTIMEWATYKDGDEKLYKGSPFAKEFKTLAGNIRAAEDARDVEAVAKLKRQWAHERFARAFEMYLEHGTAPSKALQSAFRKFKQFLRTLYIAFTGEGVRANAKVERVMARMLASEDEIEAMTLDERYKDIFKAGGEKLLAETPKETYKRWYQEAKEEAKEKLMKVLMRDVEEEKQRKYQEALDAERESTRKNLENLPLYVAQKMIKETGEKNSIVETGLYSSYGAYEAELQEYGSLEDTLNTYMEEYAKELDQKILQEHTTEEQLAKMMEQTVYHKKLMAFEAEALRAKEATANKINSKTKSAIDEISTTLENLPDGTDIKMDATSEGVRKVMQAINKLQFSTRWTAKELDQIENIANQTSKEDIEKALKQFTKEATAWKRNLKTIEDAFKGRMQIIKKSAREMLMKRSIADSCDQSRYVANEKQAAARVMQMVRAGKWEMA